MDEEINILNIPAYQRKRSIAAKGRKRTTNSKVSTTNTRTRKKVETVEMAIESNLQSHNLFPEPIQLNKNHQSEIREMKICGICEGYFEAIDVAIIKLTTALREGDIILFEKNDGLFEQKVKSMQIDRKPVNLARTGSDIGLKTCMQPKVGGTVYKVISN